MQLRALAIAAVSAACTQPAAPSAIVTEPVWHLERNIARVDGEVGQAAVKYLADADLGLASGDELEVLSVRTGADTLQHVRVQQIHRGLPVLGSEIAVHADETTFLGYGGTVTRNLQDFDVTPLVEADRAVAGAVAHHAAQVAAAGTIDYARQSIRLAIQPKDGEGAFLVWQIELGNEAQNGVAPRRWFLQVDAATGSVIEAFDGLTTVEQASGPGGNRKVARSWVAQLDVEADGGAYAMETDRLVTVDMHSTTFFGLVVSGPLDPIGDPAVNDAHGYAEVTLDMMREWMGYDSIDNAGFPIVSRVHYDDDMANAFWNGEEMTYGDGGDKFHALSGGIDVVAHEIHHGFTEKHSNLNYKKQSGGLNESFSDIAGTIAEFYLDGETADFDLGEDVLRDDGALRYMCDPPEDGHSIDHADSYDDGFYINNLRILGTDVHYSSGLSNKAFCLAVSRYVATGASLIDSVRWMGQVWYLANAGYWTSDSNFSQGCQGTIDAARALGFTSEALIALEQSWADVGVYCDSGEGSIACEADGECDAEEGETCFSCATDCGSCTESCSGWKKAKCKIGIGDCSKCSDSGGCGNGECGDDESDENCGIDCGCRAPSDSCGDVAPYGCWCDDVCAANGDCCADVEVCQ